jgi:hypothetical protein
MTTTLEPIPGAVVPTFRVLAGGIATAGWIREDVEEGYWVARWINTGRHPARIRRFTEQSAAVRWLVNCEVMGTEK